MNISKFAFISIVLVLVLVIFAIRSLPKDEDKKDIAPSPSTIQESPSLAVTNVPATTEKLEIKDTSLGTGAQAQNGSVVKVHYNGKLTNGTVFDSSVQAGRAPIEFTLGQGEVIEGWEQGIVGMKVGGKRTLTIPPSLGYGDRPAGSIPAGSTLIFDVELIDVK